MPRSGQIVPEHWYAHTNFYINDNTEYTETPSSDSGNTKMLFVFNSPKGKDRVLTTVDGGLAEFLDKFGMGSFSEYGQPLLNAFASFATGKIVGHCLRVTADDAGYSNVHLFARYKATPKSSPTTSTLTFTATTMATDKVGGFPASFVAETSITVANCSVSGNNKTAAITARSTDGKTLTFGAATFSVGTDTAGTVTNGTDTYTATSGQEGDGKIDVQFVAVSTENMTNANDSDIEAAVTAAKATLPQKTGFTDVHLYTLVMQGRGIYGDTFRHRISSLPQLDKQNNFKNYLFETYEDTTQKESFNMVFAEDASIDSVNYSADVILNDPDSGSGYLKMYPNYLGFQAIIDAYEGILVKPADFVWDYTSFDVLLGINKFTKEAIPHYTIDTASAGSVVVNQLAGINLDGGTDGAFAKVSDPTDTEKVNARLTAINTAYKAAFDGTTDPFIKSRNKFPTNLILDANYPINVKTSLAALVSARRDCFGILDCGTAFTSKAAGLDYLKTNLDAITADRVFYVEPWYGKVKDPTNGKVITVSSTYFFAFMYPIHFDFYGGKHIPLAGPNYGVLSGFIKNTMFPVMDEDIDSDAMDKWTEARANYIQISPKGDIYIGAQNTRQNKKSALSEGSNVMQLLDVVRDCTDQVSLYPYNFMETSDINRYNEDIKTVLSKYPGSQIRSIKAKFDSNDWEKTRQILHLYVAMVDKDIIKINTVEIDVNR